jgi:hypothetical protein
MDAADMAIAEAMAIVVAAVIAAAAATHAAVVDITVAEAAVSTVVAGAASTVVVVVTVVADTGSSPQAVLRSILLIRWLSALCWQPLFLCCATRIFCGGHPSPWSSDSG